MSRYPLPRQFDPKKPLEVRVWFRWAGRDYEPGQPFDWRSKGISVRRVRQMFDSGKVKEAPFDIEDAVDEPVEEPADEAPETVEDPADEASETVDFDLDFSDGLDEIYSLKDLKQIAESEGAPTKRSIKEQRDAIREHRDSSNG